MRAGVLPGIEPRRPGAFSGVHAVLGTLCLSQFTHKRTLPKNANPMKNTTKPNSFLARETIRGYIFDTISTPPSARLALNCSGKDDFEFSLAANSAINFILS
jgi:hypothetical protein